MKADVSRLPATLARLRPVTERLGMTERAYDFYFVVLLFCGFTCYNNIEKKVKIEYVLIGY